MAKKDLLAQAKALGLDVNTKMKVSEIEALIRDAEEGVDAGEECEFPSCTRTHPHQHEVLSR